MRRLKKLSKRSRTSGLLAGCLAAVALLATASAASAATYRPTRTDDPAPNGCKKKNCSLREAVIAANANGGGKIVLRPGKRYVLTRKGAGENAGLTGDLDVSLGVEPFDVSLGIEVRTKGRRGPMATIDANGIDRIFDGSPTLDRVILRDGHARVTPGGSGDGGAVRGYPRVINSRFINNTADGRGGAIYFSRGPSQISKSVFKGNSAASDGGAIYFFQVCAGGPEGHLGFGKSRATHNRSGGAGGAIFSYCGLDVGSSYIGDNSARGPGGGIFSPGMTVPPEATTSDPSEWGSSLEMSQSTVTGNRSGSYGGGIAFDAGSGGSTSRSTISGNAASTSGGGIGIAAPTAKPAVTVGVENSTLANNTAGRDGGGIGSNDPTTLFGSHATVALDHVTIARNQANTALVSGVQRAGLGGGLYEEDEDNFTVHNTLVALNTVATFHKPQASDCATPFGNPITSLGHNLVGNPVGCNGFGAAGDLFGGKLKLGKLADNGGPTKTIALMKGSRAIGHGDPDAVRVDQRGVKRDKKPDIGAYERRAKK
ncbi:MAG: choice-of-anchor Q domain-containing protein [Solirubrobacterales bacterium]